MAKKQLAVDQSIQIIPFFQQTVAEIYVGLSDEQALQLATRHNLNSHFVHKTTHRDLVGNLIMHEVA